MQVNRAFQLDPDRLCYGFNEFSLSFANQKALSVSCTQDNVSIQAHDVIIVLEWTPLRASAEHALIVQTPDHVTLISLSREIHEVVL